VETYEAIGEESSKKTRRKIVKKRKNSSSNFPFSTARKLKYNKYYILF